MNITSWRNFMISGFSWSWLSTQSTPNFDYCVLKSSLTLLMSVWTSMRWWALICTGHYYYVRATACPIPDAVVFGNIATVVALCKTLLWMQMADGSNVFCMWKTLYLYPCLMRQTQVVAWIRLYWLKHQQTEINVIYKVWKQSTFIMKM